MIRLYGPENGHASFARVAAGMRHALSELGLLAGFVPVDAYSDERVYEGADAPVGVFVGAPSRVSLMANIGWHKQTWALLPANSTWMPRALVEAMEKQLTGFIAPSMWAAGVLEQYTKLPVSLWYHGVDPGFQPLDSDRARLVLDYDNGGFEVAHLASTTMERKGTRELLIAWIEAVRLGYVGPYPHLNMIVDGPPDSFRSLCEQQAEGDRRVLDTIVWSRSRWNMDVTQAAHYYRKQHIVAQPSRGEGFGLVPLEALACATPVVATWCTGHASYLGELTKGAVRVHHGDYVPIDDGPDAKAPQVLSTNILAALKVAHATWPSLVQDAIVESSKVRAEWSWTHVTRKWLSSVGLKEDA